jgi:hypothetical protein
MNTPAGRREFLKRMAAALSASGVLSHYRALAAPAAKQVKITDVKVMLVHGLFDWSMVKIETDAGITGIGESYWGRGVKDIMLGNLRPLLIGEDPLDVESSLHKDGHPDRRLRLRGRYDCNCHQRNGDRPLGHGGKNPRRARV